MNLPTVLNLKLVLPVHPICLFSVGPKMLNGGLSVCIVFSLFILTGCETSTDSIASPSSTEIVVPQSKRTGKTQAEPTAINDEVKHRLEGQPVTATLQLANGQLKAGDTVELSIMLEVAPLWEIRTLDATPTKVATQLDLTLPDGLQATGDWIVPNSHRSMKPEGYSVYSGENVFRRTIKIADDAASGARQVICRVHYQACDEHRCLKPTDVELKVLLQIE